MDREQLAEITGIPLPSRPRLVPATEMLKAAGPPSFLVHGLMERDTFGVLFGRWGSGKSLVALDWAVRISLGLDIQGRKVNQGPAVYVVGEGHGGIARRLAAWQGLNRDLVNDQLVFTQAAVPIGDEVAAQSLHQEIRAAAAKWGRDPVLIVSDTLARNFGPGDENSNADMGLHVMMVDRWLRAPFGATVLELHHPGHGEGERGRGASALPAACDFEYRLEATGPELSLMTTKTKDFDAPPPLRYRIETVKVDLGGQPFDAPAIREGGEGTVAEDAAGSGTQRDAIEVLRGLYRDAQDRLEGAGMFSQTARVSLGEWRDAMKEEGVISGRYMKQDFYKLRKRLEGHELVRVEGKYVFL